MTTKVEKLEALIADDERRRKEEIDAPLWPVSITGVGGELSGNYYPQKALEGLARVFTGNGMSQVEVDKYVAQARPLIHSKLHAALTDALILFVTNEVPRHLLPLSRSEDLGPLRPYERQLLKTVERRTLRQAAAHARTRMGIERRGRPSEWTKSKLEKQLRQGAKRVVKSGERLSLTNVVKEMNKQRGDKKLLTDDAVKKLLRRQGVEWKNIKSATMGAQFRHLSEK